MNMTGVTNTQGANPPDDDDNIENPRIVSEDDNMRDEDDIDSETMRQMQEMYGDQLNNDSAEEISETEETLNM